MIKHLILRVIGKCIPTHIYFFAEMYGRVTNKKPLNIKIYYIRINYVRDIAWNGAFKEIKNHVKFLTVHGFFYLFALY